MPYKKSKDFQNKLWETMRFESIIHPWILIKSWELLEYSRLQENNFTQLECDQKFQNACEIYHQET